MMGVPGVTSRTLPIARCCPRLAVGPCMWKTMGPVLGTLHRPGGLTGSPDLPVTQLCCVGVSWAVIKAGDKGRNGAEDGSGAPRVYFGPALG